MQKNDYLLWICSWYPNKLKPLEGDFVQRHARAVSLYKKIIVVAIFNDTEGLITKSVKKEIKEQPNLTEIIIYYHTKTYGIKWLAKGLGMYNFLKNGKKILREIIAEQGRPLMVHAHIILYAGLLANWLFRTHQTPYVLSEQWVEYLPEAKPNFRSINHWSHDKWMKITSEAKGITTVSRYLGNAIKTLNPRVNPIRIPNVVDQEVFYPAEKKAVENAIVRFIHISTSGYQKNIDAIMNACRTVSDEGLPFELHLIIPENKIPDYCSQTHPFLKIWPEMPQHQLAAHINECDALILYSRYETFGCVIIEANACGIPVIVSDIPVMHEIVEEGQNGILAKENDSGALAETLKKFIEQKFSFNKSLIAQQTSATYSYKKVAEQFIEFYSSVMS